MIWGWFFGQGLILQEEMAYPDERRGVLDNIVKMLAGDSKDQLYD